MWWYRRWRCRFGRETIEKTRRKILKKRDKKDTKIGLGRMEETKSFPPPTKHTRSGGGNFYERDEMIRGGQII